MSMMWEMLPTCLTKLVLDLGQPIRIEQDGDIDRCPSGRLEMIELRRRLVLENVRKDLASWAFKAVASVPPKVEIGTDLHRHKRSEKDGLRQGQYEGSELFGSWQRGG